MITGRATTSLSGFAGLAAKAVRLVAPLHGTHLAANLAGTRARVALVVLTSMLVLAGCGPAPGYETEVRSPSGYVVEPPAPRTSQADVEASGEAAADAQQAQNGIGNGQIDSEAAWDGQGVQGSDVAIGTSSDEYGDTDPSALTDFKPALDGHGAWVDDATYGTVWVPSENEVGSDFVPYVSAGHWTYDDSTSWVWVSDYSWGWAPFHYGRWAHVHRGWVWIPGRTYAGAWVVWRTGSPGYDYVGWSPAPPDWYWYNGYAVGWTFGWSPYYSYCHHNYIYSPGFGGHIVRGPSARAIEARTTPYRQSAPPAPGGGRVAASPSVGAGGRVVASPAVGGRVVASPRVGGPSPAEIGVKRDVVPAPPRDNHGLERAQAFATPRTATPLGGSQPVTVKPRPLDQDYVLMRDPRSPVNPRVDPRGISPSVASRIDATARAPQVQGPRSSSQSVLPDVRSTSPSALSSPNARVAPGLSESSRGPATVQSFQGQPYRTMPNANANPAVSTPTYRSNPVTPSVASPSSPPVSAPTYRPAPSVSTPTYRSNPNPVSAAPNFPTVSAPARSTPSVSSTPTYRSSPSVSAPVRSTPSVSTPTYRSSPSVSAPVRSSPSVSAPRSTPSVRSAPTPSRSSSPVRSSGTSVRRR